MSQNIASQMVSNGGVAYQPKRRTQYTHLHFSIESGYLPAAHILGMIPLMANDSR